MKICVYKTRFKKSLFTYLLSVLVKGSQWRSWNIWCKRVQLHTLGFEKKELYIKYIGGLFNSPNYKD